LLRLHSQSRPTSVAHSPGTESSVTSAKTPLDVGAALRKARKRRKVSLAEAAESTRITARYLQALEENAPSDQFPPPPYDSYFIRAYARYLGLDNGPLVEGFIDQHRDRSESVSPPKPPAVPLPRRWLALVLAVVSALAIVALGVMHFASNGQPPLRPAGLFPTQTAPASPTGHLSTRPSPRAITRGIQAVLDTTAACWVQASTDGRVALLATLPSGGSVRFQARSTLNLVLGNAGGVRLTVNGRLIPTAGIGRVLRLSFSWRNGRLIMGRG
jgi:cytoskeleton protein RodZ